MIRVSFELRTARSLKEPYGRAFQKEDTTYAKFPR